MDNIVNLKPEELINRPDLGPMELCGGRMATYNAAPASLPPMRNTNSSSIVSLTQARQDKPLKYPDGTLLPPWTTYTPLVPYLLKPCQVITLPVKEPIPSGKL